MSDVQDTTQPEGAAPEPIAELSPEDMTEEQRWEAATAILEGDGEEGDAAPETAPEQPEPAAEPEPAPGQEEPAEAKDEAAEGKDEPDADKPAPWQFAQLRRQQKQLAQERDELRQLAEQLRPLKDDLSSMPDPRRDPLKFADWAAGRAGLTPAQLYELQTHRQLRDGQPDPAQEIALVREELAALKAEREREAKAAQERQQQARAQELLRADVDGVAQATVAVGRFAAAWPKARLAREAQAAVQWAYENAPDMTYEGIAKALEGLARDEYEAMAKTLGGGIATASEDRDTSKARDGQGTPGASAPKPAGTQPRSTLTNNDAAQGGTAHRELTDEERYALAAQALAAGT